MKQKVLFTASTYGHIRAFHLPYLKRFQELGWETHVACGGSVETLAYTDRRLDLSLEKKLTAPANLRAVAQLRALLREQNYALVVAHTTLAGFVTRLAAKGLSCRPPIVNVMHGYLFDEASSPLKRRLLLGAERLTAPETDLLLTMNAYDYRAATEHRLGGRIVNIPGIGVDFDALDTGPETRAEARARFGFTDSDFVLLYAAEFSKGKNQSLLIRALPSLPERVKLLLPGRGALLEECRALAAQLGVSERVVFPGFVSPMAPLYRLADCAVSASRKEGLPFNIMEAMYAGLPVAATAVKGHTDLLTHGVSGLLYPFGDEAAFAAAIRRLLEEPELAASLGEAAREAVLPYGLETVFPQVMDLYLSVLPSDAAPVPAAAP